MADAASADGGAEPPRDPGSRDLDLVEAASSKALPARRIRPAFCASPAFRSSATDANGRALHLLRVETEEVTDVGAVMPLIGGAGARYHPLPARFVSRRRRLAFALSRRRRPRSPRFRASAGAAGGAGRQAAHARAGNVIAQSRFPSIQTSSRELVNLSEKRRGFASPRLRGEGRRTSGLPEVRSLVRKPGTPGLRRRQACAAGEGEGAVTKEALRRGRAPLPAPPPCICTGTILCDGSDGASGWMAIQPEAWRCRPYPLRQQPWVSLGSSPLSRTTEQSLGFHQSHAQGRLP